MNGSRARGLLFCGIASTTASLIAEEWRLFVTSPQSKGRKFEAHHDPCSLLEDETTIPSPEKYPKKYRAS